MMMCFMMCLRSGALHRVSAAHVEALEHDYDARDNCDLLLVVCHHVMMIRVMQIYVGHQFRSV